MTLEVSTDHLQEPVATLDTITACLRRLRSENGALPIETLEQDGDRGGETAPLSRVVELSAEFGFRAERAELDWAGLKATGLIHPVLVLRKDNDAVIVTGGRAGAEEVSVWDPHHDGVVFFVPREDFERHWSGDTLIMNAAEPQPGIGAVSTPSPGVSDSGREATPDASAQRHHLNPLLWLAAVAIVLITAFGAYYLANRESPPAGSELSSAEVGTLLTRGEALFYDGDLATAHLSYERAANAGNGQAAIRLGETFDPGFLEHARLSGARDDRNTALFWYRRARELRAPQAEILVRSLEAERKTSDGPPTANALVNTPGDRLIVLYVGS